MAESDVLPPVNGSSDMSRADGSDNTYFPDSEKAGERPERRVETLLVEALIHLLIEKGVLTRNDALSVVQTVTQVKQGELHEGLAASAQSRATLGMLHRLYTSFEGIADRPGVLQVDGANVRRLRPPVHGDRPEFPRDD